MLLEVWRSKERSDPIVPLLGKREVDPPATFNQILVGDLNQDSGAVARIVLASAGASVVHIDERGNPVGDDFVRLPPLDVGNEAYAAGIVLERGVVQTLSLG